MSKVTYPNFTKFSKLEMFSTLVDVAVGANTVWSATAWLLVGFASVSQFT